MRLGAAWGAPGIYSSSDLYLMCGSSYVFWKLNNANKGYMDNSSNLVAYGSSRAPIFYDYDNTGYYLDPASGSRINAITYDNLYFSGDSTYGLIGRNGYLDTLNGRGSDPLELCYYDGGNVIIGTSNGSKALYAASLYTSILYDKDNTAYYLDPASTSRINTVTFDRLQSTGYDTPNQLVTASDTNWCFGCYNSGGTYYMQTKFYGTGDDSRGFRVLEVSGNTVVWRVNGAGNSICSGNVTAYSDERLKTNWQPMPENFVSQLAQVKVGVYDRIDGSKLTQVGVGAQSLQTLLPQAVDKADDEMGTLSVNYGSAALASAVELAKYVTALEQRISQLEARL